MEKDNSIWLWMIAAVVLFLIYTRTRKPATTIQQQQGMYPASCVSCVAPSGDTFPSGVKNITPGITEPAQTGTTGSLRGARRPLQTTMINARVSPLKQQVYLAPLHSILPINAPSLIPNAPHTNYILQPKTPPPISLVPKLAPTKSPTPVRL